MEKGRNQVATASSATWRLSLKRFVSRLLHNDHCARPVCSLAPPDDDHGKVSNYAKNHSRFFEISQLLALENVKIGNKISQNLGKATNFMLKTNSR